MIKIKIRIYQINHERDTNRVSFVNLDDLPKYQGSEGIDSSLYDRVFEGEVDCATLEDVFRLFNNPKHPADYSGRSLSVSDIVEIVEDRSTEPGFYFCDSFGFKSVDFSPEQSVTGQAQMRVVLCEPGKLARIAYIKPGLESMQGIVGGYIEPYYGFEEEVCIVCNEEGKINGLPANRAVYMEPEPEEMTYGDLCKRFREAESKGSHLEGLIVFTEDSFTEHYSEESRTYVVSSQNKAFQPGMGGYSIYGSALDGTDPMVRLEGYMAAEHGGKDGWKIEKCFLKSDKKEIADIIVGTFFICDCSGSDFGSLTPEQAERYAKQFKYPESFYRENGEIKAVPIKPNKEHDR